MFLSRCPFSLRFCIIPPASHAPCLVSFHRLEAFCSTDPHFCVHCQLQAASHGVTTFRFAHPGALAARIGTMVTGEEKRGAEAGGNAIFERPPLPAAREGPLGGGNLLPPYTSLLRWTSVHGRGKVKSRSLPHYFPSSILPLLILSSWALLATEAG